MKPEYTRLLETLFSRVSSQSWVELRMIPQGGGRPGRKFLRVSSLRKLKVREREGVHRYFGVLPRLRKGEGGADGIALGTCLWADLDGVPLDPNWWGLPVPTALVCSSPGKYQLYWLLENPTEDLDRLEEANARLAQLTRGDRVWDRARVLRLPGFVNWKYPERPVAKLLDLETSRLYNLDALEALLPELEEPIGPRQSGGGGGRDRRGRLPERSQEDQELYRDLWRRGYEIELREGDGFYRCPWHTSKSDRDDLHIDSRGCAHYCFGCGEGGGLEGLGYTVEELEWAQKRAAEPGVSGQPGVGRAGGGESDARIHYPGGDPPPVEIGITFRTLNDWRLTWEAREGIWATEGSWGAIHRTQERCLTANAVVFEDGLHTNTGKAPCPDPFHEKHQTKASYHLRASEDRQQGYPGLPARLAIYRISKALTIEEAGQDYRHRYRGLLREAGPGMVSAKLRAQAVSETPLAKVLDSSQPNTVTRFAGKAREQGKMLYQYRKLVELGHNQVVVEEYLLGDPGIDWGRMKGIEIVSQGAKRTEIGTFTDPQGLGMGGWSRSQWPEDLAKAVVGVLESHDGKKGRTRAGWFPGAKDLVAEPKRSPCPECGGDKTLVGPVTHNHILDGPYVSPVTAQPYYRVRDIRTGRTVGRQWDLGAAAD